jgi:hypothetical protein
VASSGASLPLLLHSWIVTGFDVRPYGEIQLPADNGIPVTGSGTAGIASNVRWLTWTSHDAIGSGELYENNCAPSYPQGHFHGVRATIRAYAPRNNQLQRLLSPTADDHK